MKARLVLAMICVGLGGCAGCQKEAPLRTVGSGVNSENNLDLWLSNESFHNESKRPRITGVTVWADGAEIPTQPRITSFNSKYGWSERAEFVVPTEAKTVKVRASVQSYGKTYAVTRVWAREQSAEPNQRLWKVESESIELSQRQEKGKS